MDVGTQRHRSAFIRRRRVVRPRSVHRPARGHPHPTRQCGHLPHSHPYPLALKGQSAPLPFTALLLPPSLRLSKPSRRRRNQKNNQTERKNNKIALAAAAATGTGRRRAGTRATGRPPGRPQRHPPPRAAHPVTAGRGADTGGHKNGKGGAERRGSGEEGERGGVALTRPRPRPPRPLLHPPLRAGGVQRRGRKVGGKKGGGGRRAGGGVTANARRSDLVTGQPPRAAAAATPTYVRPPQACR